MYQASVCNQLFPNLCTPFPLAEIVLQCDRGEAHKPSSPHAYLLGLLPPVCTQFFAHFRKHSLNTLFLFPAVYLGGRSEVNSFGEGNYLVRVPLVPLVYAPGERESHPKAPLRASVWNARCISALLAHHFSALVSL